MASVEAKYNYGNVWELEALPCDEFESAQMLCDYYPEDEEGEEDD